MQVGTRLRGWLRARAFKRLRNRHGQPPRGLSPGEWIDPQNPPPDATEENREDGELARKAKMLGEAFREARGKHPAGRKS